MNAVAINAAPAYGVTDLERMARAFATSKLFGVQNPEQALALCLVAQAEGRHPATAAQDYSIIQGRPSKKADAMLRDFLANGGKVQWHTLDDTVADASFSHPSGGTVRIDWTLDRAKKAGLASNAMYSKYPRQMLRSRTISEGVRTVCPGATSGMYVPEEVVDFDEPRGPRPAQIAAPVEEVIDMEDVPPVGEERHITTMTEGRDWYGCNGEKGMSAHAAKQAGADKKHDEYRGGFDQCGSTDALRAYIKEITPHVSIMPLSWRIELRSDADTRAEELGANPNADRREVAVEAHA